MTATERDRVLALAAFEPVLTAPGFTIGRWVMTERDADGVQQMPWFEYSVAADDFRRIAAARDRAAGGGARDGRLTGDASEGNDVGAVDGAMADTVDAALADPPDSAGPIARGNQAGPSGV